MLRWKVRHLIWGGIVAVCLVACGTAAHAAESAAPTQETGAPADSVNEGGMETDVYRLPAVTVTANKQTTEVQKTPIALTVFTEQDLEDRNIKTVRDVLQQVPNLTAAKYAGGFNMMSFRGATTVGATNTSPLIMYLDGVPVDTFYHLDLKLLDIERVEVLRGPQSAIYGKNALGGVINIISKKPDNNYKGKVSSYVESDKSWGGGATISGPLKEDVLFFSLAAAHDYSHGYMDNDNTNKSNFERVERTKGQLRFTPSDKAEFNLHIDYTARRDGFTPYALGTHYTSKSVAGGNDEQNADLLNAALVAKFDFDPATFESITTFRYEDFDYRMNSDPYYSAMGMPGSGMAGRDNRRTEVTQELRLRSPDNAPGISWLFGVYASYGDFHISRMFQDYDYYMMPGLGVDGAINQPYRELTTDLAPFAQVVFPVTDAFKVTTGLRYHYTRRRATFKFEPNESMQQAGQLIHMITGMDPGIRPHSFRASDSWDELLPKLNLSYSLTDDHMLYAGVSRSFIPGGFNYATMTNTNYTYDSQTAWNYEVGAKTSWFDQRLNVNLALFYSRFKDLQIMQYNPAAGTYLAMNAGSADSYGAELEMQARLAKGLDATIGLGYTHARYDDYKKETATGTLVLDDKKIELTPEYTANAALRYRHDNGLFLMGQMNYLSKIYWDPENEAKRSPVTTVDAKIGYEGEHFEAYLYGKNIFGERYQVYYTPTSNIGIIAPPQTFGIEVAYKF